MVACTFLLNDHYATVLFDSGADYSFISTGFIPLLGVSLSPMSYYFEIEMADGGLVKLNQIIHGCTLVLEDHPFSIDLIPFEMGSFDVIVGMDWMSKVNAVIEYGNKVVWIPLPNGKVLRVRGEQLEAAKGISYEYYSKKNGVGKRTGGL